MLGLKAVILSHHYWVRLNRYNSKILQSYKNSFSYKCSFLLINKIKPHYMKVVFKIKLANTFFSIFHWKLKVNHRVLEKSVMGQRGIRTSLKFFFQENTGPMEVTGGRTNHIRQTEQQLAIIWFTRFKGKIRFEDYIMNT